MEEPEDSEVYRVVVNDEDQYSIWLVGQNLPPGWKDVGRSGLKQECLDYIKQVWKDMRPASLRKSMQADSSAESDQASG